MSDKLIKYTVSIYTENSVGLLNRISAIFQRRHINIESFNSSMTEIENVQRWTILVITSETYIKKIVGQINRQVEVIQSYYHTDEETIYQESCLFKIKSSLLFDDRQIQNIIKESNAIIVTVNPEFFVIEKDCELVTSLKNKFDLIKINGGSDFKSFNYKIPSDISSAAFFIILTTLSKKSKLIIPFLRKFFLDVPNKRSSHSSATPSGGGLGFIIASVAIGFKSSLILPLISLPLSIIGFFDDLINLSPFKRIFAQSLTLIFIYSTSPLPRILENHTLSKIIFVPLINAK